MKKRSFFDVQSPALEPIWLRAGIVAGCFMWAFLELMGGAYFWAIVFGAAGAFLYYQFFRVWNPPKPDEEEGE